MVCHKSWQNCGNWKWHCLNCNNVIQNNGIFKYICSRYYLSIWCVEGQKSEMIDDVGEGWWWVISGCLIGKWILWAETPEKHRCGTVDTGRRQRVCMRRDENTSILEDPVRILLWDRMIATVYQIRLSLLWLLRGHCCCWCCLITMCL